MFFSNIAHTFSEFDKSDAFTTVNWYLEKVKNGVLGYPFHTHSLFLMGCRGGTYSCSFPDEAYDNFSPDAQVFIRELCYSQYSLFLWPDDS